MSAVVIQFPVQNRRVAEVSSVETPAIDRHAGPAPKRKAAEPAPDQPVRNSYGRVVHCAPLLLDCDLDPKSRGFVEQMMRNARRYREKLRVSPKQKKWFDDLVRTHLQEATDR